MRRFVQLTLFLLWVDEASSVYDKHMFAPFHWVGNIFIEPIASIRPIDMMLFLALVVSLAQGAFKVGTVQPLKRTMFGAIGVVVLALIYGLARGGNARAAGWQCYLPIVTILAAFSIAATHRTAEHFSGLFKVFVACALIHAIDCIIFHFLYIRPNLVQPLPEDEARHDDTILWTGSIGLLLALNWIFPSSKNRLLAGFAIPILWMAMRFNRRRLADVSLLGVLVLLYFLMPAGKAKRWIQRAVLVLVPLAGLYVAIGWNHPTGIFSPLKPFTTMEGDQDKSTRARMMENLGLIATAQDNGWLMGSGWGHKYHEVSSLYAIYFFELWPYVPHNSVLGLVAYTGYVGLVGYWMLFPMTLFFHARTARLATRPMDKLAAVFGAMLVVVVGNQWYGDMGSFTFITMYAFATTMAIGLRVPISSGTWSNATGTPRRAPGGGAPATAGAAKAKG